MSLREELDSHPRLIVNTKNLFFSARRTISGIKIQMGKYKFLTARFCPLRDFDILSNPIVKKGSSMNDLTSEERAIIMGVNQSLTIETRYLMEAV